MDGDGWLQQGVHWSPARGPNSLAIVDLGFSSLCSGHHAKERMVCKILRFFSHLSVFFLKISLKNSSCISLQSLGN